MRKSHSKIYRIFRFVIIILLAVLIFAAVFIREINNRLDVIVAEMVTEGLKNTITDIINEAVYESMMCGDYSDMLNISKAPDGGVRSISVNTVCVNLLRADVGKRISEKLAALEKYYVDVDISNVFDDVIVLGSSTYVFVADVVPVGGLEMEVKSGFESAGVNQTKYSLELSVDAGVSAIMLITNATIDVKTNVNIAELLIVGDVPNVYFS